MTARDRLTIRPVRSDDLVPLLALNESALPNVNSVPLTLFEQFAAEACYFGVACHHNRPVGFLIGLTPEADYASLNFQWFKRRYDAFCYIDRIVISRDYRRFGAGRQLYQHLEEALRGRVRQLACEVNLRPRNDSSLMFHAGLGFSAVGTQDTEGDTKTVQLMMKSIT